MNAYIPYGAYWSTPFAKWQGSIAHLNPLLLVAQTAQRALQGKQVPTEVIDLAILGHTNPYKGSFYGLPYVTGLMGLGGVAGPTVQQACATSVRALQMAAQEVVCGTASCALLLMADKQSSGPVVHYPDPTGPGGYGITEHWVPDNMACDPYAGQAMLDTGENVARRYGITTAEQHALKLHRYQQYIGALADERAFQRRYMVDVPLTDRSGRKSLGTLSADEGVFPTTAEGLAKLKPAREGGTITFGAQTHPADGNAGAIVTTRDIARVEKSHMPMAPVAATRQALQRAGLGIEQIDAIKTHNPFAVNDIALARDIGFAWERMNNYGSSIVWGHPQAPTGMRGVIELIEELALRGGGTGLFTGCAAGDTGLTVVLQVRDARRA
jgi:acetyl-CoA acetyltransferase